MCVYQEHNGNKYYSPVRDLGCRYVHICIHSADQTKPLSAYWENGQLNDAKAENISKSLKFVVFRLYKPGVKGIPIGYIDTHSLRSGDANALEFSGYSDREINKMGRWRSAKFMEYIREELSCFAKGMSKDMKPKFNFVNIAGGAKN